MCNKCTLTVTENKHVPWENPFLPCDAMHKRGLCHALSVCVSVCLSRSWVVSKRINIFEIFSPSGSQAILVFPYQTAWQYLVGNPRNGGVECRWGRQKSWLSLYLAWLPAISTATGKLLSTGSPVDDSHRVASYDTSLVSGGIDCGRRRRNVWQEASTLRQRQQNSAFNCTQW